MSTATVSLGEVCDVVSGATPKTEIARFWGGDIPWTTPKDLSNLETPYLEWPSRTITEEGLKSCAARVLPANSILLSSRAPIGLVAINAVPMATNQGFKSLVPSPNKLDSKFLYHWLRSKTEYLQSLGNGATFKEISKAIVERIEIPLPPLDEQRRIAAILDKADALRRSRRHIIELISEVPQSLFVQLFGGAEANPKRWNKSVELSEVSDIASGITKGRKIPNGPVRSVPYLAVANVQDRSLDLSAVKSIEASEEEIARLRLRARLETLLLSARSV